MERLGRAPEDQWWTINGEDLLAALRRAHSGDAPEIVYLELLANSEAEDFGDTPPDAPGGP